jgi:hypothetical protein
MTFKFVPKYNWMLQKEIPKKHFVSIQHYVIKFVSDLRQVGGFLRTLRLPPSIKLTTTI